MSAENGQLLPARARLLPAVRRTARRLNLGPEDAGMVRLAEMLARTIDDMDAGTREKMLAQTAGQLHRILDALAQRSRARLHLVRGAADAANDPRRVALEEIRARRAARQ